MRNILVVFVLVLLTGCQMVSLPQRKGLETVEVIDIAGYARVVKRADGGLWICPIRDDGNIGKVVLVPIRDFDDGACMKRALFEMVQFVGLATADVSLTRGYGYYVRRGDGHMVRCPSTLESADQLASVYQSRPMYIVRAAVNAYCLPMDRQEVVTVAVRIPNWE